ncbi:hypothetical protein K493DRAFT_282197 [Basidiobolus meristosporus CBS 931.73]|uniref:Ras-GEF domain-containing protein n=1 Tax=Basidiobolus meristosporus CBS 931.73 TaxID=1314790 RepID=A0A1Y1YDW2_9FUNG|nr:hypothetical protein K493DRAFT_282197 [Basidiobolus meristosporus CBS 931.73]|eukprot:ORX96210.1 hypothetical protein K493DRAFT_282197 [Basidiobolus meristosporus CBS 931.73]
MDEIQQLLTKASTSQGDGGFEEAYFLYLYALEVAANSLKTVVFENQVIIKKPRSVNHLFESCQKSVAGAQAIIQQHSINVDTHRRAFQPPPQSPQDTPQPDTNGKVEIQTTYQMTTPRKRVGTTKYLRRLAIVHDDSQPLPVFSDENYDWSCDDSDQSTTPNSPDQAVFSAISPPESPLFSTCDESPENRLFSAISPPESPNFHPHKAPVLSIPNNMILPQQTYIHIVPEGSVDPLNLVPAQADESVLETDHVPSIPKSPLLSSYHMLSEKLEAINTEMVALHNVCRTHATPTQDSEQPDTNQEDLAMFQKAQSLNVTITETQSTLGKINNLVQLATTSTTIYTFSPRLVAYQLTLIESALFQRIPPNAVLTHSPRSPHPAIVASTDFFNYLTRIIEISILSPVEASHRAQILNHWIRIASRLYDLNNFQTLKAVLSATGTPPVERLKRTWACIPKKSLSRLDSLRELMSEDNNYGKYREITIGGDMLSDTSASKHILPLTKPTIPFLGVFIMDITYLLAATKKSGANAATTTPGTPSVNPTKGKSNSTARLEEDPRVQTLLAVLRCYLAGPKYPPDPPPNFLKSKSKFFTFSTNSLSSENQGHPSGHERSVNGRRKKKELDSIYTTQQVILHHILCQLWMSERQVDEISKIREPKKGHDKPADRAAAFSFTSNTGSTLSTSSSYHSAMEEESNWEKQNTSGIRDALGTIKHHLHFNLGHSPSKYDHGESKLGSRKPSLPNLHRARYALGTPPAEGSPNYEFSFSGLEISSPIPLNTGIRHPMTSKVPRPSKSAESLRGLRKISSSGRLNHMLNPPPLPPPPPQLIREKSIGQEDSFPTEELMELLKQRRYDTSDREKPDSSKYPGQTGPTPVSTPTKSSKFSKRLKPLTRTIRNITN